MCLIESIYREREKKEREEKEESGTVVGLSLVCNEQIEFLTSLYYSASEMSLIHSRFFCLVVRFVCLIEFMIGICLAIITLNIYMFTYSSTITKKKSKEYSYSFLITRETYFQYFIHWRITQKYFVSHRILSNGYRC